MKKSKYIAVLSFVVITLLINTSCMQSPSKIIFNTKKLDIVDFKAFKNELILYKNSDGGYGFLPDEYYTQKDLYTSYYAIETLRTLGNFNEDKYPEMDLSFVANLNKTSIAEIFFFTSLFKEKIIINDSTRYKIESYILSLFTDYGTIANSNSEKTSLKPKDAEELYTSTYFGLKILNMLKSNYDKTQVSKWINNTLNKLINDELYNKDQIGNLNMIISMSKIVNNTKYIEYKDKIINKISMFENDLTDRLNSNLEIPLYEVDNYYNIMENMELQPKHPLSEKLNIYIQSYQKSNGGFGLYKNDQVNILPTYMAVNILINHNNAIPNENKILALIKRYKLVDGYYIPIAPIESDLQNTFYVYSILKLLEGSNIENSINSYIEKFNMSNLNNSELVYYCNLKNSASKSEQIILSENVKELINNLVNSKEARNDYNNINLKMRIIQYMGIVDISKILNDKDIKYFNTYSKTHQNLDFIFDCLNMRILSSAKTQNTNFENDKMNKIKQALNYIHLREKSENLLYLYIIIDSLNDSEIVKLDKGSRDILITELGKCYLGDGIFKLGPESDRISYCSSYYGIYIMKRLKML